MGIGGGSGVRGAGHEGVVYAALGIEAGRGGGCKASSSVSFKADYLVGMRVWCVVTGGVSRQ